MAPIELWLRSDIWLAHRSELRRTARPRLPAAAYHRRLRLVQHALQTAGLAFGGAEHRTPDQSRMLEHARRGDIHSHVQRFDVHAGGGPAGLRC
jgi:hypothetical protein